MLKLSLHLKTIIPAFLVVLLAGSCNRYDISEKQSEVFMKFFGSYREDAGADVQIDEDGGYVIVGTWSDSDTTSKICLIRTDKYGNELGWSPGLYGIENEKNYGYGLLILTDGYVLVGACTDPDDQKNIIMVRTDKQGNALAGFPKVFELPGNEEGFDIAESDNSGFIIVGYADNLPLGNGGKDVYFLETDADGDSIRARNYGSEGDEQYNCITKIPSGYMLLGKSNSYTGDGTYDLTLIKTNNLGVAISAPTFGSPMNDEGESLIMNDDGTGILAGTSTSADGTQSSIYLAEFNSDFIVNAITVSLVSVPSSVNLTCNSVVLTPEGNYVLVGTETQTDENIYLLGLDSGGNEMFYTTFGRTGSQTGSSFRITADGGFIIVGSNAFEGNSMITLIKTGPEGSMD
jgi:hypothetical protein